MTSDPNPASSPKPAHAPGSALRRRRSRGGRGRGRGRGHAAPRPEHASGEAAPPPLPDTPTVLAAIPSAAPLEGGVEDAPDRLHAGESEAQQGDDESFFAPSPDVEHPDQPQETAPPTREPAPRLIEPRIARSPFQPASPEAVKKALDEVMTILSGLREAVDKMDEVLEVLEEAERQKTADEREIEALRQQLRRFHRPAEEIPRPPRPMPMAQQGGPRENPRDNARQGRGPREPRVPYRGPRDDRGGMRDRRVNPDPRRPADAAPPPASSESNAGSEQPPAGESSASTRDPQGGSSYGTDAGDPS